MGVLVLIFFLIFPFTAQAAVSDNLAIEVIYDMGDPDASVGIVGDEILEVGSYYQDFEVTAFVPDAIILKEVEGAGDDFLKWMKGGAASSRVVSRARRLFVVKQLRAIHKAQHAYFEKFHDSFAENLNTLIDQGFLPDGFQDMKKQNYHFRVLQAGEGKKIAIEGKKQPVFFAVAEPVLPGQDPWYFGVDQLGQVRYAKSLKAVQWGPVWEYNGLNEELSSTVITHEEDDEL